jgi:hypothetical protein
MSMHTLSSILCIPFWLGSPLKHNTLLRTLFHFNIIITKNMQKQQQQPPQHQQPQQKLDRRSAGLEELIMGCTSSRAAKGVSVFEFSVLTLRVDKSC